MAVKTPELELAWDAAKAQANLAKHGVSFAQAATVLLDPLAISLFDEVHGGTEDRWFTLGSSQDGKLLAVAHTYRSIDDTHAYARVISARQATRREREQYQNRR